MEPCKHESDMATMALEVTYTKQAIDNLTKAIMGNGKIGLGDRVLIIEQKQNEIEDIKKSFRVFKKNIEDKVVTKNDFLVGSKVGQFAYKAGKVLVWAVAIAIILSGGAPLLLP